MPETPAEAGQSADPLKNRRNIQDILALLPLQTGLFLRRSRAAASTDPGFLQVRFTLVGSLDAALFEEAWNRVLRMHPALRMTMHGRDGGDPLAIVWRDVRLPLEFLDWRGQPDEVRSEKLATLLQEDQARGLELEVAPSMRVAVIRTADSHHEVLWTCHHIFFDGWSASIAAEDLVKIYLALAAGRALPEGPGRGALKKYLGWVKERDGSADEAFWRAHLSGFVGSFLLPRSEEEQSRRGAVEGTFALSEELTTRIERTCVALRVTPSALVQGAWALSVHQELGVEDVVIGNVVSGRSSLPDGLERLVGYLGNVLPFRVRLKREQSVAEWLRELRNEQFSRARFEQTSLASIYSWLELAPQRSLLETLLVFQNYHSGGGEESPEAELALRDFRSGLTTTFPLTVAVIPGDTWSVRWRVPQDGVAPEVAASMVSRFGENLEALAADAERPLGDLLSFQPVRKSHEPAVPEGPFRREQRGEGQKPYEPPRDKMEIRMTGLFEAILETSPVGVQDDFFGLGGNSLAALRLVDMAQEEFGKKLSVSDLLKGPTIAALTDAIREDMRTETAFRCVVPLRSRGKKTPVICVHGGHLPVILYRDLANRLGPNQPVFALEPPGMDGQEEPLGTVEALAERYCQELMFIQPEGPYRLVGYCMGASICVEMARNLRREGKEVDLCVVVDSLLPPRSLSAVQFGMNSRRVQRLFATGGVRAILQGAVRRLRRHLGLTWNDQEVEQGTIATTGPAKVAQACGHALAWYQPKPLGVPVTLIWNPSTQQEHLERWREIATSLELVMVDIAHEVMMQEPEVRPIAEIVRDRIEVANARREGTRSKPE